MPRPPFLEIVAAIAFQYISAINQEQLEILHLELQREGEDRTFYIAALHRLRELHQELQVIHALLNHLSEQDQSGVN